MFSHFFSRAGNMSYSRQFKVSTETTLNVTFSGSPSAKPSLVFLHFWGGSSRTFAPLISHFSSSHHCIAIDLRGWGESTGPRDPAAYSIAAQASDIRLLCPQLGLNSYILIGHSMGAKVVQLLAGSHPLSSSALKGVVLIAPAPPTPLSLPPDMRDTQLNAYSSRSSAEFTIHNVLTSVQMGEEQVGIVVEDMLRGSKFAKAAWPAYGMKENVLEEAKKVNVRVLVIVGEDDKVEPPAKVRKEVLGVIGERGGKRKDIIIIEGAGHLVVLEKSAEVAQVIKEFINEL